jgi:hypothetical protein
MRFAKTIPFLSIRPARRLGLFRSSRDLLPTNLPLFSRFIQLSMPLGMDLLLTPGEHALGRDVADRTVEADAVVMLDAAFHQTPRIV